jgi:hypothetical protein
MVFKGVDVAFDRAVGVGKFAPFFAALTFAVRLAELAFFGHDYGGDFQFQEFPVFDTTEASIKADALQSTGGKGGEKTVCQRDDFGTFIAAGHDFIVMDKVVLVGGDEEAPTEFYVGAAFAFGDPFGVLFEEGVEFFSGGNFTPFQESVADEKDVFDEEVVPVFDGFNLAELDEAEGLFFELFKGGTELFFELVELGEIGGGGFYDALLFVGTSTFTGSGAVPHGGFDAGFPVGSFTPTGELEFGGETTGEVDDFAGGVPGEVEVGGEVNVRLKDVTIDFDLVRFFVFF